jgi:signal transduction histidine kinase
MHEATAPEKDSGAIDIDSEIAAQTDQMSALVSNFEWAATPLGPSDAWPESLRTTVRILLTSRFPMWMAWGPELTVLYNDAYARTTLGKKHPWALGKPAHVVWSEIWKDIGPRIHRVLTTGEASWDETLMLILERSGYPEETFHTFSYSPLADSTGRIAGMLCVVMEESARVIGERQVAFLSGLAASLTDATKEQEVFAAIERGLAGQRDLPFALVYLFSEDLNRLRLVASTGIGADHPAAAATIGLDSPWPVDELLTQRRAVAVNDLRERFAALPRGPWDEGPAEACLVPIVRQGQEEPVGVFIAALNPYRQLDASYAGFLDLAAGQIGASITNAQAFELERKRAEALAELDRAKTTFFSNVSHELRTPLTLILGPVEDALANEAVPSPAALEMLHRNATRLLKLVNGLLDFVRIEVGRMGATYQATDLSLLTAQLSSVFRSAVERAGLQLVVECAPLPEPVYVDREMWEKVVLNLLSNALKSTFDGEIRVRVEMERAGAAKPEDENLENGGGRARVTISDTGTGIAASDLSKLFQRFQRIEGARRRSHEGSGIGLALVSELVQMHGGTIGVESRLGEGTSFVITLPFGHGHLPADHVRVEAVDPVKVEGSAAAFVEEALDWLPREERARRLRGEIADPAAIDRPEGAANDAGKPVILLADDNADMREYLVDLLSARFRMITAKNGRHALEEIENAIPDLVLTDVMMPEMDGFALLKTLRRNPATRSIPVIMLSARAGEEARMEGIDAGADDYLVKPFTARELMAHIESQLKMARLRREALEQEAALTREIDKARLFASEALDHIPDAFCIFDREFRLTYMNVAAAKTAERSGVKPMDQSLWDLYPMLRDTELETNFRRAMEERVPVEFEYNFKTERGESWFQFRLYPLPGDGVILYLRNTTEARKTEQALLRSQQLAAAGRLAASISHEINNPLEAVTNLLFLVKLDTTIAENTRELLDVADKELQRLSHIAARSLKFYRQRTAPALTSLEELIDSVIFFNEPAIRLRNIRVERRFEPAPPVLCMPGEIQQVFTNLINNALEALSQGGQLTVAVRRAHDRAGRDGVAVTIADSGYGMDEQTLSHLFQPFMTTKGESGTGLGLWVSKGIVEKHHSTIQVRSRPGKGTVFRMFFPADTTVSPTQPA